MCRKSNQQSLHHRSLCFAFALLFSAFSVAPALAVDVPFWLDFDNSDGNTRTGYIGFQPSEYNSSRGYGWDRAVDSHGYWGYDYNYHIADFHRSEQDATFRIDVANGLYTLYLEIDRYSRDSPAYDKIDILVNGELSINDFSPEFNKLHIKELDVEVTGGALTLAFHDDGGQDSYWLINSLRLMPRAVRAPKPIINTVSGDVTTGSVLSIHGSRFGAKTPAAPILFDNFEHCTNGGRLSDSSSWQNYNSERYALCSSQQAYSGTISAHNFVNTTNGRSFATAYFSFPETDTVYLTYKTRYDVQGDGYGVRKLSRVTSKGPGFENRYNGPGTLGINNSSPGCTPTGCDLGYQMSITTSDDLTLYGPSYISIQTQAWTRLSMYTELSTPGVNDGVLSYSKNSALYWHDNQITTRGAGQQFSFFSTVLGIMMANPRNDGQHWMYVDDVYLDNTQKRVELCNASLWEAIEDFGALCEPQIPSAWSDSFISVSLNKGALDFGTPLFLFVINEDGIASSGYPLTSKTPRPPGDLRIRN